MTALNGRRMVHLARAHSTGAVVAQVWQAATSFGLQVAAAHLLGAQGLGVFALCFGIIVTATAIVSGAVGDSLTVLDRHDRAIRAGLQWWTLTLVAGSSLLAGAVLAATQVLSPTGSAVFVVACLAFQVEEILRRLFMARLSFWHLVVVDSTALVASLTTVAVVWGVGQVSLTTFLAGIAVGQICGSLAALTMLPRAEKQLVSMALPARRKVGRFGLWRGAQVTVTPGVLTASRSLVLLAAGVAALGELEAARLFVAPAILAVQGLGSYLLATYARDRHAPLQALVRRASRASSVMAVGTLLLGALVAASVPWTGHLVTGASFRVSSAAVFGWAVYAAASATVQPFASLAAARGRQRVVFAIRVADSALGLSCVVAVLGVMRWSTWTVPFALAVGLVTGGLLIRLMVLRPMTRTDRSPSTLTGVAADLGFSTNALGRSSSPTRATPEPEEVSR